jgi:hypothetical protein
VEVYAGLAVGQSLSMLPEQAAAAFLIQTRRNGLLPRYIVKDKLFVIMGKIILVFLTEMSVLYLELVIGGFITKTVVMQIGTLVLHTEGPPKPH